MKANKIEQDKQYEISIGKNTTVVRVVEIEHRVNGTLVFQCENIKTGKPMVIADADRFRKEVKDEKTNPTDKAANQTTDLEPESVKVKESEDATEAEKERSKGGKPSGKMSALDAAHEVLQEQGREMKVKEITDLAISSGKWSPAGKTPVATLSAAVQMDIIKRGNDSRFVKTGRGLFAAR